MNNSEKALGEIIARLIRIEDVDQVSVIKEPRSIFAIFVHFDLHRYVLSHKVTSDELETGIALPEYIENLFLTKIKEHQNAKV